MRILLVLWMVFIFIGTCTSNVKAFLLKGNVSFRFSLDVNWAELYHFDPLTAVSEGELIGHFFMFFMLAWLAMMVFKSKAKVIILALAYGVITEVLQLFFVRGADPYDLFANIAGMTAYLIYYISLQGAGKPAGGKKKDQGGSKNVYTGICKKY